jgi:preprotein translocase subunit SecG
MMTFILIIHAIVSVLLLLAILMQAGRGGGLTEQFASAESVFGAQTNVFMVRTTSVLATIFFVTCLSLAYMSARQERSLVAERSATKKAATADMTIPIPSEPQAANAVEAPAMDSAAPTPVEQPAADAPDVQTPVTTNAQ